MQLGVAERILLANILTPAEGDVLFLRGVRKLREALSFSEEEHALFKISRNGAAITWDEAAASEKDIEIGPVATEHVKRCLQAASSAGRLPEGLLRVYDALIPEE